MHWIQTIREKLELSQSELAHYLRLSVDMIKSVEIGRRELPFDSLQPAITLYQALNDLPARGLAIDPTVATDDQVRLVKRLHRLHRRRMERCAGKLEEMRRAHATACSYLGFYQFMAHGETDPHHLKWIQLQIEETTQRIKDNNATMQNLLVAEIAGLKSAVQVLEGSIFSAADEGEMIVETIPESRLLI